MATKSPPPPAVRSTVMDHVIALEATVAAQSARLAETNTKLDTLLETLHGLNLTQTSSLSMMSHPEARAAAAAADGTSPPQAPKSVGFNAPAGPLPSSVSKAAQLWQRPKMPRKKHWSEPSDQLQYQKSAVAIERSHSKSTGPVVALVEVPSQDVVGGDGTWSPLESTTKSNKIDMSQSASPHQRRRLLDLAQQGSGPFSPVALSPKELSGTTGTGKRGPVAFSPKSAGSPSSPGRAGDGVPTPGAHRRRTLVNGGELEDDSFFAPLDRRVRLVDADDTIVFVSDIVYIVASVALCIVAVFSLAEYSEQRRPPTWLLTSYVAVVTVYSAYWMLLRGRYTRRIVGEWGVTDSPAENARLYRKRFLALDLVVTVPLEFIFIGWLPVAFHFVMLRHVLRFPRIVSILRSSNPLLPARPGFTFFCLILFIVFMVCVLAAFFVFFEGGRSEDESLYWAAATMTSTGYGDIVATNKSSRWFSIAAMVVSLTMISALQAFSTSLLTNRDVVAEDIEQKKKTMHSMLHHYNIPWTLQKQVIGCFPGIIEAQRELRFKDMTDDMPPHVAEELEIYMRIGVVRSLSLFADMVLLGNEVELANTTRALAQALTFRTAAANEYICVSGEGCKEMLIFQSGVVELVRVVDDEEVVACVVRRGMSIGEACLDGTDRIWTVGVQAMQPSSLLALNAEDFAELVELCPVLRHAVIESGDDDPWTAWGCPMPAKGSRAGSGVAQSLNATASSVGFASATSTFRRRPPDASAYGSLRKGRRSMASMPQLQGSDVPHMVASGRRDSGDLNDAGNVLQGSAHLAGMGFAESDDDESGNEPPDGLVEEPSQETLTFVVDGSRAGVATGLAASHQIPGIMESIELTKSPLRSPGNRSPATHSRHSSDAGNK
jgi:hypothetical protein